MEKRFFFSTKALIMMDDKFLAMYSMANGKKLWDLPGGRMEFGENAEETLAREIAEELSIKVKPIKLVDTWNYMRNENFQVTGIIYYCEITSGEIKISDEHDGYEWIGINDIGEVFTSDIFEERMKAWNWDAVSDSNVIFRRE